MVIKEMFSKFVLYIGKKCLKLWFHLTKRDPRGSIYETIDELIKQDGKPVDTDESRLLGNVLDLKDTEVFDIMIPKTEIVAMDINTSPDAMVKFMLQKNMTSILLYKQNLDDVLGFVRLIDLVKSQNPNINQILNKVQFISPSMRTLDLLLKMRETGEKMAIVVDEYGGVDGLVIFSDLIEEIIGDIHENDNLIPPTYIEFRENGDVIVDGYTKIRDLEEQHNIIIHVDDVGEDITTVGGMVSAIAGRVPSRGELIQHKSGQEFLVLEATPRFIKRVCVKNPVRGNSEKR